MYRGFKRHDTCRTFLLRSCVEGHDRFAMVNRNARRRFHRSLRLRLDRSLFSGTHQREYQYRSSDSQNGHDDGSFHRCCWMLHAAMRMGNGQWHVLACAY